MIDWLHEWPTPLGAGLVIACFLVPTLVGSAFLQPVIARLLRGERDPNTPVGLLVDDLDSQLLGFRPDRQSGEDILHSETLRSFGEFVDRRRLRIQAGGTSIPAIIWYVVLTGAVLNVFVLWLFDLSRTTHFVLGGVLTVFIGLVIYMVAVLDQPFRGVHGLAPDDLLIARRQISPH